MLFEDDCVILQRSFHFQYFLFMGRHVGALSIVGGDASLCCLFFSIFMNVFEMIFTSPKISRPIFLDMQKIYLHAINMRRHGGPGCKDITEITDANVASPGGVAGYHLGGPLPFFIYSKIMV